VGCTHKHPQPKDILLLIEVSDSGVDYDRTVKIPLYAENQISEVWLVDLNASCLEIYRKPYQNYYQKIQKLSPINSIILSNFPEFEIKISDLF
jgi:Uma2 family endonuclease